MTPLLHACQSGHAAAVDVLLELDANPLACDRMDKTAIFLAAEYSRLEVMQVKPRPK